MLDVQNGFYAKAYIINGNWGYNIDKQRFFKEFITIMRNNKNIGIAKCISIMLLLFMLISCVLTSCDPGDGDTSGSAASNGAISNDASQNAGTSSDASDASDVSDASDNSEAPEASDTSDEAGGNSVYAEQKGGYKLKVKKLSSNQYRFTSHIFDDRKVALTLDKRAWGTYILGSWTLSTAGGNVNFTGGSTDMEYVYRASDKPSGGYVWSGGNHGNETLVSLEFYDGETLLDLDSGKELEVETLTVVQKTHLHLGNPDDYYAAVTRNYTITAEQIRLDCEYDHVKDVYWYLSYTCMMPISKAYGTHADYYANGKLIYQCETGETCEKEYASDTFYEGYGADCVVLYGNKNPRYKIQVRVLTPETATDNFSNTRKTMFWDMNKTHNKLYFSKYEESTPTLVAAGTKYTTSCSWLLIDDEA